MVGVCVCDVTDRILFGISMVMGRGSGYRYGHVL
jgi:hypothetical protein